MASAAMAESIADIIADLARHEENCRVLSERYGARAKGRCNVVTLTGKVQDEEAKLVREIRTAASRSMPLHVLIDSSGGLSRSSRSIVKALVEYPGKKVGVVTGACSSGATIVLAACDERIAPPTANFLIHGCGYKGDPPRHTVRSLEREVARLGAFDEEAKAIYKRAGALRLCGFVDSGEDHQIDADEARRFGLLTAIEPSPRGAQGLDLRSTTVAARPATTTKRAAVSVVATPSNRVEVRGYAIPWLIAAHNGSRTEFADPRLWSSVRKNMKGGRPFLNFDSHDAAPLEASITDLFSDDYGLGFRATIAKEAWRHIRGLVVANHQRCSIEIGDEEGERERAPDGEGYYYRIVGGQLNHVTITDSPVFKDTGIWPAEVVGPMPPRLAALATRWNAGYARHKNVEAFVSECRRRTAAEKRARAETAKQLAPWASYLTGPCFAGMSLEMKALIVRDMKLPRARR